MIGPANPTARQTYRAALPPSLDSKSAVIVIEIADSDIHFMEPRDVLLSELSMKINDRSKLQPVQLPRRGLGTVRGRFQRIFQ